MTVAAALDRYFGITEKGSSIRTEVKGGILVFLAMSYIIVVNTGMMVDAGIDHDAAFSATIVMSIIGSVIMGLYAKFPVAMAPGMGINAMFCYTAVLGLGFSWQTALVAIFISGLLFFIITATGVRQRVLDRIPHGIKSGITAGIGCFIAFIGLQNAGIIANSDTTLVTIGDLADPAVLLGVFCLLVTILLVARRVSAGVLIAMILTAVVGMAVGIIQVPDAIFSVPSAPPIGEFVNGLDSSMLSVEFVMIVVAFAMVEFFDGSGTLMAVGKRAGFVDDQGNVTCDRALNVDAGIAAFSGVVGCTPTTAFAESAVGVEAGARTGLAPDRRRPPVRSGTVHRPAVRRGRLQLHRRCNGHRRSRDDNRAQGDGLGRPPHVAHHPGDRPDHGAHLLHHRRYRAGHHRVLRLHDRGPQVQGGPLGAVPARRDLRGVPRGVRAVVLKPPAGPCARRATLFNHAPMGRSCP